MSFHITKWSDQDITSFLLLHYVPIIIRNPHFGVLFAHHIYLSYGAFQSTCIYLKYVNHRYLWYHPHVYIWSMYILYTYTMVHFKAHVCIWTLLIYYVMMYYINYYNLCISFGCDQFNVPFDGKIHMHFKNYFKNQFIYILLSC